MHCTVQVPRDTSPELVPGLVGLQVDGLRPIESRLNTVLMVKVTELPGMTMTVKPTAHWLF